jgi:hypothetical protein
VSIRTRSYQRIFLLVSILMLVFSSCLSRYGYIPRSKGHSSTNKKSTSQRKSYQKSEKRVETFYFDSSMRFPAALRSKVHFKPLSSTPFEVISRDIVLNNCGPDTLIISDSLLRVKKADRRQAAALIGVASVSLAMVLFPIVSPLAFILLALLALSALIYLVHLLNKEMRRVRRSRSYRRYHRTPIQVIRRVQKTGWILLLWAAVMSFFLAISISIDFTLAGLFAAFGVIAFFGGMILLLISLLMRLR